jgi:hypothetical protein
VEKRPSGGSSRQGRVMNGWTWESAWCPSLKVSMLNLFL